MNLQESFNMNTIDLKICLQLLQKWKWLIAGITLLAVVTSAVLSFFVLSPVYQSKTVIMVKQYQDPKAIQRPEEQDDLQSVVNSLSRIPEMTIKTYVGQMKSEALLRTVINELKLDKAIYTPDSLAGLIDVKAVPETNLIELTVKNNDSKLAATIANTLAEKFLEFIGTTNQKQLVTSSEFLSKQLSEKNKELTAAMTNLNKYRNQPRNVAYLEQELENKNNNLAGAQSQLLQVEADLQQALAGKAAAEQRLKTVPQTIKTKSFDTETGKPVEKEEINPAYIELTQLVAQKSIIFAEIEAKKNTIKTSVEQLQNDLKTLQTELNSKRETDGLLQEKVNQIKQTRDILSEKLTQVEIVKSVNVSQTTLQIVTPAFPQDKPISPKKILNMAVAMVLGLMASIGLVFILEFTNNTINKPEDIDQHLGLPVLGSIPLARVEDLN